MTRIKSVWFKLKRKFFLFVINTFLCTTNFFKLKRILLRRAGITLGENSKIVGPLSIGTVARLEIGDNCWIGAGLKVYGNGVVVIGDNCDLAPDISFITGSHRIGGGQRRAGHGVSYKIYVRNGVWIGARATIMGNTVIHESSIVGACSLVTNDVLGNSIFGGIPAKKIKILKNE